MAQKVLLFLAVTTTLITFYFGFGTEPDVTIFHGFGYRYGWNLGDNAYWKLAGIAFWGLYILSREIKNEGDSNNGSNGNLDDHL